MGIDVVWAGPDGVLGTADDETFSVVTDADGGYLVDGLPAGEFDVTVDVPTVPAGLVNTADEDGDLDSHTPVSLEAGEEHLSADFGYRGDGVIGDTIYLDLDGDGTQGPDEPGVPDQPVVVLWGGPDGELGTDDDVEFPLVTDDEGTYLLEGLPDGPYSVTVTGGITESATNTGDPDGGNDSTSLLTIDEPSGREHLDQDFGYQGPNSLGDTVWWDLDGNGVDDDGEPRLPGVELEVIWFGPDGVEGGGDDVTLPTALTDADGTYLVTGLPDGTYRVAVVGGVPAGLAPSYDADSPEAPDAISVVELVAGEEPAVDLDQDFGYAGTGTIGDTVWLDTDGDGVREEGEPGLPGATVTLTWGGPDGDLSTVEDNHVFTTTVAADGSYLFERLPAGTFGVEVGGLPAGLTPTADPDGGADSTSVLTLEPGESNLDQDFGYVGSAGVGDTIWLDVDSSGTQDPREPGLPNIPVTVTHGGADGIVGTDDDIVITTVTDSEGHYSVVGLPPGPVRVAYPSAALDAGLQPGSDLDGERESGEQGIPGVTVIVTRYGPDGQVRIPVTTGPDGSWSLPNLPPGEYSVEVDPDTVPDGPTASSTGRVDVTLEPGGTGFVEHGFGPQPTGPGGVPLPPTGVLVGSAIGLAGLLALAGLMLVGVTRRRGEIDPVA